MPAVPAHADLLIDQALVALAAERVVDALELVLTRWRDAPHPRIAQALEALSHHTCPPTPPELRSNHPQSAVAWNACAQRAAPLELPALIETLVDASMAQATARLGMVAGIDDPRLDAALVHWLETIPFQSNKSPRFWAVVFERVRRIRDTRQLLPLAALDQQLADNVLGGRMHAWLREQLASARPALREPGAPPARIDELDRAIAKYAATPVRQADFAALLDAVHATPLDDGPRAVYADALIEVGDPRGEFIVAQLRSPDPLARKRAKELLHIHGKAWLGELAPIVEVPRFERGFLASCRIDDRKTAVIARLVGHPDWSTVHTIAGPAAIVLDPVMRALRTLRFHAVAEHDEELPGSWRDLLALTPRAIEDLHYTSTWPNVFLATSDETGLLATCAALPALRRLAVTVSPYQPEFESHASRIRQLLEGRVVDRLACLAFDIVLLPTLIPFIAQAVTCRVPRLQINLRDRATLGLELLRGDTGYDRGTLTLGGAPRFAQGAQIEIALAVIAALPPTVRSLELAHAKRAHNDRPLTPAQIAQLEAAIAAKLLPPE